MFWGILFLGAIASSSTGGNLVGPGGQVVTGSAYAESIVNNVLSGVNVRGQDGADGADGTNGSNGADGSNGKSVVDITTTVNGTTRHEHYESSGTSSGSAVIRVSAVSTSSGGVSVMVSTSTASSSLFGKSRTLLNSLFGKHASTSASSTEHAATSSTKVFSGSLFSGFSSFFSHVWSIFGF